MFSLFCRTLRATLARVSRWQVREYILLVLQYCAWCLKILQAIVKTVGWIKKLPPRLSDANVNSIIENLKVPTDLNVLLSWKWMSPSLPPGFKSFFFFTMFISGFFNTLITVVFFCRFWRMFFVDWRYFSQKISRTWQNSKDMSLRILWFKFQLFNELGFCLCGTSKKKVNQVFKQACKQGVFAFSAIPGSFS